MDPLQLQVVLIVQIIGLIMSAYRSARAHIKPGTARSAGFLLIGASAQVSMSC